MDTKLAIGLVAGALLIGTYYVEDLFESGGPLPAEYLEGPEARIWLHSSDNESALASNRFLETRNALRFVQELYEAGADRVIVPRPSIADDGEEKYADSLVVFLPTTDAARRERVWKLCAQELKREGGEAGEIPADGHVMLWWD